MNSNLDKLSLEGFLEYAQEANTRSTLAVEDGLKPVHRRILYSMYDNKILHNKPSVKSMKIVGDVLGNYHPHGDSSVYDAAVRLSQNFKLRYPLITFEGNGGSIIEPDSYAHARYTSMRLSALGELMLQDIEKNTVPMVENYDGELTEPVVLPSMVPNVLLNGGMGIGVGISSSLLPHNLTEVSDAIIAYIKNPRITVEELMHYIQGPDFPTGGIITDAFSLATIYEMGKGTIKVRAKYTIQTVGGRNHIVITEVPYLISIESRIISPIQQMVVEEGYDKIYEIQNNSGKNGIEIRIILEKDANPNQVLQTLFEKTGLESVLKINQTVMLNDGSFTTLGLRGLISHYLTHQHNIITRKYTWELNKAKERLNIVEGLIIAIQNIDEVVQIIKNSSSTSVAKVSLMQKFSLNEPQVIAILDIRLARLTKLEINKLVAEKQELENSILLYQTIINSEIEREKIIITFLTNLKQKFGDSRRTKVSEMKIIEKGEHIFLIVNSINEFTSIMKEDVATLNRLKKSSVGKEYIISTIECNTKDILILLTADGKAHAASVEEILNGLFVPESQVIQILKEQEKDFITVVTQAGIIKKTPTIKIKKSTVLTKVRDDDKLIGMYYTNDTDYIMVLGLEGKAVNIPISDIAAIGKLTFGAKGILTEKVIAATVATKDDLILTITADNKAKFTKHDDFLINGKATTGQLITEDCVNILSINTSQSIAIFGLDWKATTLNINSLAIKGRNSIGAKIFNSEIAHVISL